MSKKINRENDTVEVVPVVDKSEVSLREEKMQRFWVEHDIFNKSLTLPGGNAPKGEFIFYDGPPFATGTPHYGHILAGTIKDAIPRFWTMNGYSVSRKWGWDCHGLPLENIIEKRLGLSNKRDIEDFGIKNFNEAARSAVMEYADDWKKVVPRMGRFADMENDYKTMDSTYTESVWWAFKTLHEKGLVYEGYKVMHLCPRCGTTLSNFEVNLGYKDIKDIAVTVKMPLLDDESGKVTDTSILIWTTTPWTLPGNMAVAVNQDFVYVKVKALPKTVINPIGKGTYESEKNEFFILAKEILIKNKIYGSETTFQFGEYDYEIIEEIKGSDLVGRSYQPPFDYIQKQNIKGAEKAWKIYHADYVELGEEGTGVVHIAPAYGEEDSQLAQKHEVPVVHHVDLEGRFMDFVTDFAGQLVKPKGDDTTGVTHLEADIKILKHLQEQGKIFKKENITHSYPHCWRDETPLLNYATTSWFVKVTDIKNEIIEANNSVHWVPENVGSNRFGRWLEGARDWAISRQRYWGAPLPIWRNKNTGEYKVLGSLAEIKEFVPKSGNTYHLMRHGESVYNSKNILSTNIEESNPLTEKGRVQVNEAAAKLKDNKIDLIIASPFERTKATAEIVRSVLDLTTEQVILDERLGEINLSNLNGQANTEYYNFLQSNGGWCTAAPVNGESWSDVKKRVGDFLYEIESKYTGKNILIISHNSPLRMLGAVNDGQILGSTAFDHDEDGVRYENAEVRELSFVPLPHNDNYELDYHRPYIDEIALFEEGEKLERVPDVFDCWFESGSMPYAQHHYPFENKDDFLSKKFPAQFVAEGLDQTRGWFYSLIVLGVALFGKSPYQNVIVNGLVLAEDGKKMSKSLQNYPDPMELVNRLGADTLRYYLLSSPVVHGEDLAFSEQEVLELQRKNIGRLHNVLAMYEMFEDGTVSDNSSSNVLDRWIINRLNQLIEEVTTGYKNYELDKATRPIADFIEDLSVWYLRRSRERLKGDDALDKKLALGTLRYTLRTLALVMAPAMPFYAEYLYLMVKEEDEVESVHLAAWPIAGVTDEESLILMKQTREIVSEALELRAKANVKVRQPLAKIVVSNEIILPDDYKKVIEEELNVKSVLSGVISSYVKEVDFNTGTLVALDTKVTPELKAEGDVRAFIRSVQQSRKELGLHPNDAIILKLNQRLNAVVNGWETEFKAITGTVEIQEGIFEPNDFSKQVTELGKDFFYELKKV